MNVDRNIRRLPAAVAGLGVVALLLSGCGGGADDEWGGEAQAASLGDAPASPQEAKSSASWAQRSKAAHQTANSTTNACAEVQPFYWEVGNGQTKLAGGSVASPNTPERFEAHTEMNIASASKWVYGAYVAERRGGQLSAADVAHLNFTSGYTNFSTRGCDGEDSVGSCLDGRNLLRGGTNGRFNAEDWGRFYYNGAHMQAHAAQHMGLGALRNAALSSEVRRVLGLELNLAYTQPQLAGRLRTTADDYAQFLRKVLRRELRMGELLGQSEVCTNPATCPTAVHTPVPPEMNWNYSLGHWVEYEPSASGLAPKVVAYSSTGAFGFYPWIAADKAHYGVLARAGMPGSGQDSAACGRLIRMAWTDGVAR